ncbi:YggS family pyridoxal phosphate enzyme [Deinococcus rubellus]|uniref:Alanine racemase n=1 Tax=Deinococcus rubellus TaxID=1889240 RepID=A0ABY5YEL3_9DEIO|nr:alanine racemase [Deinococcus rubellus]UWX63386.1 alanine racemase [Deinococcus rubellus]
MTLNQVLSELHAAQAQSGRPESSVRLVVVSKGRSLDAIEEKILSQASALPTPVMLAENRGQELRDKVKEARERGWAERFSPTEWHFIGPLQRNKIKYLEPVSLIHTLEAAWQVHAIAQAAEGWGKAPAVLIQLHNGEAQKHGVAAEDAPALYHEAVQSGLEVRGVMVMAPYGDLEAARQVFGQAARCAADLNLSELSMGMSDDFIPAVQQGATLVRIGRRLFT